MKRSLVLFPCLLFALVGCDKAVDDMGAISDEDLEGDEVGESDSDPGPTGDSEGDTEGEGESEGESEGDPQDLPEPPICGPLVSAWELSTGGDRVESIALLPGGMYVYETSYGWSPRGRVTQVDEQAELGDSFEFDSEPGEGSLSFSHVAAGPEGELATLSAPGLDDSVIAVTGDQELWSWAAWDAGSGSLNRDLIALPGGGYALFGENYLQDWLWLWIVDEQGGPVKMFGGPEAAGEIYGMHAGGIALSPEGELVIGGWITQSGYNDVWVAKLNLDGDVVWQTELSNEGWGNVAGIMVDFEGSIYAAVDEAGLYKLSAEGEELWSVPVAGYIGTAALLGKRDPVLASLDGLSRYDGEGVLVEQVPTVGLPIALEGDASCRLALGGANGQLSYFEAP